MQNHPFSGPNPQILEDFPHAIAPMSWAKKYAWLKDDQPKHVIMGDDLDAALATLLYLRHNPSAVLGGVYCGYQRLCYRTDMEPTALAEAIYIDLDIVHATQCRSVGHHILRCTIDDRLTGLANNCNPNEWLGRSVQRGFAQKYPLGTVHLLMALYNEPMPAQAEALVWLADSAFINGQSHRFRDNMQAWLYQHLPHTRLQQGFEAIDTKAFEAQIAAAQSALSQKGFAQGRGQVRSRHLGLTGFQCQPDFRSDLGTLSAYFERLLGTLAELTGWHWRTGQVQLGNLKATTGHRTTLPLKDVLAQGGLDVFLEQNSVFSYAFPFRNSINFTVFG
jgi:hypothetical protein